MTPIGMATKRSSLMATSACTKGPTTTGTPTVLPALTPESPTRMTGTPLSGTPLCALTSAVFNTFVQFHNLTPSRADATASMVSRRRRRLGRLLTGTMRPSNVTQRALSQSAGPSRRHLRAATSVTWTAGTGMSGGQFPCTSVPWASEPQYPTCRTTARPETAVTAGRATAAVERVTRATYGEKRTPD